MRDKFGSSRREDGSKRRFRGERTLQFLGSFVGMGRRGRRKSHQHIPIAQVGSVPLNKWMADWMKNPSAKLEMK
ncbi:MAG: hypothetical protein HXY45_10575 [Syntrophaceae bacterium]|jgi:hypothetical protein|nr:hypothetical protein [Syntrophaceae bacterium]